MAVPSALSGVHVGLDALRVNPLRTILSTLGVIIGVASLVAVLSLGDGMERMARENVERFTDVQTIGVTSKTTETIDGQLYPVRDYPVFTLADARSAREEIDAIAGVSLSLSGRAPVESPETNKRRVAGVTATLADADRFMKLTFFEGRYFTESEASRNALVVVLSYRLAYELAAGRAPSTMMGRTVKVNGSAREVIGILSPYKGERALALFIPFTAAVTVLPPTGAPRTPGLLVKALRVEDVDATKRRVEDWLGEHFGRWERRIEVTTSEMRLAQATQGIFIFKLFMGAITGISLIVGGIGIMNVLLASVTERTREIGIRKAIGAQKRDILLQFLAESVAISGAGSVIGVAVGLVGAFTIVAVIRAQAEAIYLDASFSWSTVLSAALSAIAIGLVFGTYPARRASRLSPIDAIRHE
jgi:putative ABC transport system permease protein